MYYILATKIPRISKDYKSWSRWKYHRYFSLQPALLLVVFIMDKRIKLKLRNVFSKMKDRCSNNKLKCYKNYWWKWVKVLRESFEDFLNDMSPTFIEWLTIERIDSNWNYCKENCKRATRFEQNSNTNRNVKYQWKHIAQWCRDLWISKNTVNVRRLRWMTIEQALFIPNIKRERDPKTGRFLPPNLNDLSFVIPNITSHWLFGIVSMFITPLCLWCWSL